MGRTYKGILEVHQRSDLLLRCIKNETFEGLLHADKPYSGRNRVKYQFDELLNPSEERAVLRSGSLEYHRDKKIQGKPKKTIFTKKRPCALINKDTTFKTVIEQEGVAHGSLGFLFDDALVGRKQDENGKDKYIWGTWAGTDKAFWLPGRDGHSLGTAVATKEELQETGDSPFNELLRPLSLSGLLGIICYNSLDDRLMMWGFYVQEMIQNHTRDKNALQLPILPLIICDVNGDLREYKLGEIAIDLRSKGKSESIYVIANLLNIDINLELDLLVDAIIEKYKPYSTEAPAPAPAPTPAPAPAPAPSWITTAFKWIANSLIFIISFPFRKIADLVAWLTSGTQPGQPKQPSKPANNGPYAFEINLDSLSVSHNESLAELVPIVKGIQNYCKNRYDKNNLSPEDRQLLCDFWTEITMHLASSDFNAFIEKVEKYMAENAAPKGQVQKGKQSPELRFSSLNEEPELIKNIETFKSKLKT